MEEIIWWPRSHKKNEPQDQTQKVFTVIGTKKSDLTRWLYLALFFLSASSATAHTSLVANAVYEEARVSGQVTSHNSTLPLFQGMVDILSGCLPSDQYRPVQTWRLQMAEDVNGQQRMLTHIINSCMARMTTFSELAAQAMKATEIHLLITMLTWGIHKCTPGLRPVATRTTSSSMWRPRDGTERVVSQAPNSLEATASRRAWVIASADLSKRES